MKTCITVKAEGKRAGMALGHGGPLTGNKQFHLMYWSHGKGAKKERAQAEQQSRKISCAALIGLTQAGQAALLSAKEGDDAALRANINIFTCKDGNL